jgi:hypothetical protein
MDLQKINPFSFYVWAYFTYVLINKREESFFVGWWPDTDSNIYSYSYKYYYTKPMAYLPPTAVFLFSFIRIYIIWVWMMCVWTSGSVFQKYPNLLKWIIKFPPRDKHTRESRRKCRWVCPSYPRPALAPVCWLAGVVVVGGSFL